MINNHQKDEIKVLISYKFIYYYFIFLIVKNYCIFNFFQSCGVMVGDEFVFLIGFGIGLDFMFLLYLIYIKSFNDYKKYKIFCKIKKKSINLLK